MGVLLVYFLSHLILLSALSIPARAASLRQGIPDEAMLASLEQRAAQAPANEQCYLYARLVHEMIEYSASRYASGDVKKATGMLQSTKQFIHKIRIVLTRNSKKLKDTQILLRRTAFRLTELLHSSNYEDRPLVQEMLAQLNQIQDDAMMQVFRK